MAHTIDYDAGSKIWKSCNTTHLEFIKQTIGEAYLKKTKTFKATKVLESYYDTGANKTVSDIQRESITVAINLRELGLKHGDVVLLYSDNNDKISALTMGSYIVGLPVNFFETTFNSAYEKYTLELLSPTIILFQEEYKTHIETTVKNTNLPHLKHLISIDGTSGLTVETTLFKPIPEAEIEKFQAPALGDPEQVIASYILTSGSTGLPKAVALSHASMLLGIVILWSIPQHSLDITDNSIMSTFTPLRWISQAMMMLQSLIMGIQRVVVFKYPSEEIGREIIRNKRISLLFSSPTSFQNILMATENNDLDALDSLRVILFGGETTSQSTIELTEILAPKAVIIGSYGMTETAGAICVDGYLAAGSELKILNDNEETVGPMTNGKLVIRSPVPIMGYLNISRQKDFYEDGFFNTGDYGYMDDNKSLHVFGRYKDLVRCKDVILIPNQVEDLINALPEVSTSVLVGYRKTALTTEDTAAIFIVLAPKAVISAEKLFAKIRKLLKCQLKLRQDDIFKDIEIIEKCPLSNCGKIERTELAKLASQNYLTVTEYI